MQTIRENIRWIPGARHCRVQVADAATAESPRAEIAAGFVRADKRERRFRKQPDRRIRIVDRPAEDGSIAQIGAIALRAVDIPVAGAVRPGEDGEGRPGLGQEHR